MANLNIGASLATVASLTNLPVTSKTVYATLSAPSNLSLAEAMYQGQIMDVVINPTEDITLPMPTTTGWYTTFGDTLPLVKGAKAILTITCIGSGQYLIAVSQDEKAKYAGYDYVDLGLPSGLLWATCNVGASQPHEFGKYFQWGATEGYYSGTTEVANHSYWDTCPWGHTTPPMTQLDAAHDAARANMGGKWRMPTSADIYELSVYTTTGWTTVSGVNGMKFINKSNSSNSIFIPAAGLCYNRSFSYVGSYGYCWSSSFYSSSSDALSAYVLIFYRSGVIPQECNHRTNAIPVRGVIDP